MATGIGEASAILSVAQIGISLSKSLITYIEEVKGAPSHIRRIGNEILTTSERLKDVGELVIQNPQTKVFSEEGINSAVRCSTECQQIIEEVKNVLCKGGWQDYPKVSDKDEVDTSLFSTLRWPFAKLKLEVPRAELHKIKLDLSLLFSAAMVLGASTAAGKQRLAQDIPELHKARQWAARRAEKVKEMAQYRSRNPEPHDTPWSDDEPEMLEEFLTFKEKAFREEEEKMIRERARVIQAEDDARKRKDEDTQHEVERKAVEEYKKTQKEQEARSAEKRENFRKELERLGLESAQIQMVMESSNLDFQAASATAFVPEVRPSSSSREISGEQEPTPSATSGLSRLNMPWWRSKKSTRESSSEPSLSSMLSESSTAPRPQLEFQTWLIDFCTNQETEVFPSAEWLIAKLKTIKKDQDVWNHFAKLAPHERHKILAFLGHHRREDQEWTLYHLQISRRHSRTRFFSQRRDEQLVQLILCRRRVNDQDSDVLRVGPKTEGPGGGLPKRVSFAEGLEEESGAARGVKTACDYTLRRSDRDLRERIARLEEKRNGLGLHDHERIADLNDIIDYLQDRLKPDATDTSARDTTTFHHERQPEPMRSDSTGGPAIVHEEVIPNSSQRNDVIRVVDRLSRSSTAPPPPPSQRLDNMDDISAASHHPQGIYEDIEVIEDSSRPERTYYEGRYGDRNSSRNRPRERRSSRRDDEDVYLAPRDHDRSSQIGWQERSRSRSRFPRQDSFDTRGGPIVIREVRERDRSWERTRSQPVQPSRQLSQDTDYYDHLERRRVANDRIRPRKRANGREEEEGWPPEMRQIIIRRDGIYKPTPRDRQYFSSSGSEYSFNGSRIRRGQPIAGKSGESQALVLRAGAYGPPHDYVRERVLNGGIRVRGESPEPAVSQHVRRLSRPPTSRRNSYRDQSWAPSLRRRLSETWHQFDSNEDEDSGYPKIERTDSGNDKPETELSDAEVIAQTLKQFTTIQDSDMPVVGISAPPARTKAASEMEVGRSALKNAPYASSGPERKRSPPVPGRKAHFEQENGPSQTTPDDRATNERLNSVDEKPFLDRISEEPGVMDEDSDIPHHQRVVYFSQRPVLPHPQPKSPVASPPDLAPCSREVSPRPQSRDSDSVIDELRDTRGERPDHASQEEGDDEVEVIHTISRDLTTHEEELIE